MGLGALSFDLLIALVITSLLRRRLGYRSWRAIHWLAYGSWPVAVLHGLGTGSDTKSWWMLLLTIICVGAVVIAVLARICRASTAGAGLRAGTALLSIATPVGIAIFTLAGPLQKGWARRAGTPASLLGTPHVTAAAPAPAPVSPVPVKTNLLGKPFTSSLSGTISQSTASGGAIIELSLQLSGGLNGQMRVRMGGMPLNGGGLSLTGSQVDLTASGLRSALAGKIVSLQGDTFLARVSDSSGTVVQLHATLVINANTNGVSGTVAGTPLAGGK
jgi:hypothetical protein